MINLGALEPRASEELPAGFRARTASLREALGAQSLGATVWELDEGERICPYHYEIGIEEWLIVLSGSPLLRTPEGEERLEVGDVVYFPEGPEGAHTVTGVEAAPACILMISTQEEVASAVYPDSAKVGVWPPGKLFLESDAVPYWTGEL